MAHSKKLVAKINKTNIQQKITEIRQYINKGNILVNPHRYAIDCINNGWENGFSLAMLNQAYKQIKEGTYEKLKNCHFGVEHMVKDGCNYVYYKGQHIEHFTYESSEWFTEWKATLTAARICKLLEEKSIPINWITYCGNIGKYLTPEEIAVCENVKPEIFEQIRA